MSLLSILLAFSSVCGAADYSTNEYAVEGSKTVYFKNTGPTPNIWDYIKRWESMPNANVNSAIGILPENFRMSYVLMHNSGSIQGASFQNPRAILFTPTADLVVAFNGKNSQVNGNRIEAMAFNNTKNKFDLIEVSFVNGKAKTEINPRKCTFCHTDGNIPNWRQYNNWSGAYGANSNRIDYLVDPYADYKGGINETLTQRKIPATHVLAEFKNFVEVRNDPQSRYHNLVSPPNEPFWPLYSDPESGASGESYDYSPNRRLGIGLTFHMARSIGNRLSKTSLFKNYPATLISGMLRCKDDTRLQLKILELLKKRPLFETADAIRAHAIKYNWYELAYFQLLAVTGIFPDQWRADLAHRTLRLQGTRAEEDTIGFGEMDLPSTMVGTYLHDLILGNVSGENYQKLAINMGIPTELIGELNKLIPVYSWDFIEKQICPQVLKLVDAEFTRNRPIEYELNSAQWAEVRDSQAGKPYVLKQCMACHTLREYAGAPYIPFDQPVALKEWLSRPGVMDDIRERTDPNALDYIRMPHGPIGLLPEKRDELLKYLENL